jgi:amidase
MTTTMPATATELARAIANREVTVPEVVAAHLARIEEHDPLLHAFVARRDAVVVRREALDAQRRVDSGEPLGPLHGVPFTVKDILATADVPTACGSAATPTDFTAPDATAVARLRTAGALLLGKTACPEFAFGVDTQPPTGPSVESPWGPGLTPGGSSGGEAAAIASGMSPLGLGTDFGGSLRWPAMCVGIVSLRPTVGRVPGTGQLPGLPVDGGVRVPNPQTLQGITQVIGPLARCVDDLQLALDIIGGPDGWDGGGRDDAAAGRAVGREVAGLRVGWLSREDTMPVRADVSAAVEDAARTLAKAGALVEHRPGLLDGAHAAYNAVRDADGMTDVARFVRGREHLLGPDMREAVRRPVPSREDWARSWGHAVDVRRRILREFGVPRRGDELDVLLCPVAPVPAFLRGEPVLVEGRTLAGFDLMALCRAVTLTGLPVVSVPVGRSAEGLPLSVQVVARPFEDETALAVARVLEAATGRVLPS